MRRVSRGLGAVIGVLMSASFLPVVAPIGAAVAAPVGQGFNLNASDLRFILKQIKIAEEHARTATATNPCGTLLGTGPDQIPNQAQGALLPWGLRTVDGTCNNLLPNKEKLGAAGNIFPRRMTPQFRDAELSPAAFGPPSPTSYTQKKGLVFDSQPRVASNLIVDQTAGNPAAVAAAGAGAIADASGSLFIQNVAPDVGLSAPYNSWFTLFGQFFDHGLDLTNKGGSGTVFVPLKADDPLFVAGSPANFMVLTRATNLPGPDTILGTPDDIQDATNKTSTFVDQSQTYTSHPSHQVFLRRYANNATGDPVSTGKLIDGADGGMATWADVKAQASAILGIALSDQDVLNVPLLATDPYGKFVPGANGNPQMVTATGMVEGVPGVGVAVPANVVRTGTAFLDDIAHHAVPGTWNHDNNPATPKEPQTPDADPGTTDDGLPGTYDNEMLDSHFMAGDGRVNENIGLTAVHQVFHAEHNRLADDIKTVVQTELTPAELADWQLAPGIWNGERLFQAARFVTEMEYQHLAFEEFARKVQPMVNLFAGYDTSVDPALTAEFAQAVYRFGHSMLTETVARTTPQGVKDDIPLLDAFLTPQAYTAPVVGSTARRTPRQAAGDIVRGMTDQAGNEIDEFVTEALRNKLLGLPLDLATLNMARARETGMPSLNGARRDFLRLTNGNTALAPYANWLDFGPEIKHPESLINFVAAYGKHSSIAGTAADKRAAAKLLVAGNPATPGTPTDSVAFMNGTGAWANVGGVTTTGLDDVDLWMGGLAEKQSPFGGLLGSSFNFIFETQMENLQDGDRFYYLSRTAGLNMLVQLEGNSFAELIMRNTDVQALPADVFSRPDFTFDLTFQGPSGPIVDDPNTTGYDETTLLTRMTDGSVRYAGLAHVVFTGTPCMDRVRSSEGDDTLRGQDGSDRLEGGAGNDQFIGGLGNDILTDTFGDDVLKGGDGNDALSSGAGFDLNQAGRGNDFTVGGSDPTETFGGPGNDKIFGGDSSDTIFGDDGDDWIEGGGQADLVQGDNGAPFQDDPNTPGHDVLNGNGGADDYDAEGGDDIMVSGPGVERNEGMLGFDWVTHKNDPEVANDDLRFTGLLPPTVDANRDRFDVVEGLSGWEKNDTLRGDDGNATTMAGHELNLVGMDRIPGLRSLLPAGAPSFNAGNIVIGGGGSDLLEGRGGDDIIDGDAWLNVQLRAPNLATTADLTDTKLVDSMTQLQAEVFAGLINPGDITIVRSIATANVAGDVDTAVFSGPQANYSVVPSLLEPGTVTVAQTGANVAGQLSNDGTDTLRNIERLQFSDGPLALTAPATVIPELAPVSVAVSPDAANEAAAADACAAATAVTAAAAILANPIARAAAAAAAAARSAAAAEAAAVKAAADAAAKAVADAAAQVVADAAAAKAVTDAAAAKVVADAAAAKVVADAAAAAAAAARAPAAAVAPTLVAAAAKPPVVGLAPAKPPVVGLKPALPRRAPSAPVIGTPTPRDRSAIVRWRAPNNGNSKITGYSVRVVNAKTNRTVGELRRASAGATSLKVTGLVNGTAVKFQVRATNAVGTGAFSARSSAVKPAAAAPTVIARTPALKGSGVSQTGNITATFSKGVTGVTGKSFTLRTRAGKAVAARVSYNTRSRVATLNPTRTLAADTTYVATLSNGVKAGKALATTRWSFITGPRPTVKVRIPGANAAKVARSANVRVRFSERVVGVSGRSVLLMAVNGRRVAAVVSYNARTGVATLNPTSALAAGTRYTVVLGSTIKDRSGNALTAARWSFTTGR